MAHPVPESMAFISIPFHPNTNHHQILHHFQNYCSTHPTLHLKPPVLSESCSVSSVIIFELWDLRSTGQTLFSVSYSSPDPFLPSLSSLDFIIITVLQVSWVPLILSSFVTLTWQNSSLRWTQAFAFSELVPELLGIPHCTGWQYYLKTEISLLSHPPSDHFMTCLIPWTFPCSFISPNCFQLMNLSSLRNRSYQMETSLSFYQRSYGSSRVCIRPLALLFSQAPPAMLAVYLLLFPYLTISPFYWIIQASSNSSLDPIIFLVIAPFLCLSWLSSFSKDPSVFCLYISTKNILVIFIDCPIWWTFLSPYFIWLSSSHQ